MIVFAAVHSESIRMHSELWPTELDNMNGMTKAAYNIVSKTMHTTITDHDKWNNPIHICARIIYL